MFTCDSFHAKHTNEDFDGIKNLSCHQNHSAAAESEWHYWHYLRQQALHCSFVRHSVSGLSGLTSHGRAQKHSLVVLNKNFTRQSR